MSKRKATKNETSIEYLNKADHDRDAGMLELKVDKTWNFLCPSRKSRWRTRFAPAVVCDQSDLDDPRDDPRFAELVRRVETSTLD